MPKIKRYIDCYIPITTCNLRCSYCYIAQRGEFKAQPFVLSHSLQEIAEAFSLQRIGGPCLINLCAGGETLLYPEIMELMEVILRNGHYLMLVTNGLLTHQFEKFESIPEELRKRIFVKFSFHYLELKRLNKFDDFFANVARMKRAGASFTVELTPCDEEIPYIEDIKKKCMDYLGALCHVTIARSDIDPEKRIPHLSKLSFEEYVNTWKVFDSALFDTKVELFYRKRTEYCYAGDWGLYVNLETGNIMPCYCGVAQGNIYDTSKSLPLRAFGARCEVAHCYNGHSWLVLGMIPELELPTYAELRNRVCVDGTEWLSDTIKEAFGTKLKETNEIYSNRKKKSIEKKAETRKKLSAIKRKLIGSR